MGTHTPIKLVTQEPAKAKAAVDTKIEDTPIVAMNAQITPVKRETQEKTKKAFLKRGSSSKYNPQEARKQSQGST